MPHICTRCNSIFDSGEDILKGCPACGWKKFLFVRMKPAGTDEPGSAQIITKAMGVRAPPGRRLDAKEVVRKEETSAIEIVQKPSLKHFSPSANASSPEDIVSKATVSKATVSKATVSKVTASSPKDETEQGRSKRDYNNKYKNKGESEMDENEKGESEKLESIKITAPGTYELNLPSLFEREELIMAVKEGTYFIDLSSAFRKGKKE